MKRCPPGSVDRVVPGGRAFPCSLLPGCYLGLLGLDAFWTVEHDLNHGILHQRGKTKEQASNEPNVDSLNIGHFRQFGGQGSALGGQRQHWEDACTKKTNQDLVTESNIQLILHFWRIYIYIYIIFYILYWYLQEMSASPWQPAISSTVWI